jgi:hypothetical protein
MQENVNIANKAQSTPAAESVNLLYAQKMQLTDPFAQQINPQPVQCKLTVGAVDDPLEDEADDMADRVMRMPEQTFVQLKCAHCEEEEKAQRKPVETFVQKKCAHCEAEEKQAQRKPLVSFIQKKEGGNNATVSDTVSNQIQSTRNSGNAMHETTKSFMESRFGADFSNVNIHTGSYAVQMSRDLNAQAFTVGNNIYFNEGKYSPDSFAGKQLLAHELTHTIQQSASGAMNNIVQSKQNIIQRKEEIKPISESKEGDFDGKKIKVERIITPGECKTTKNSSSSAIGGFKNDKVFFEAKGCKNNVTGEAYGDLDFKDFVDGANNFIKAAPNLISGNASDNFKNEIDKDFKDANLKASLRLVLRIGHVRVETTGTGSANADKTYEAGVTGFIRYANGKFNIELGGGFDRTWSQLQNKDKATVHLYTDIGPIIIRVDATHTNTGTTVEGKIGDSDLSKNHGIGVTYTDENGEKKVTFNINFTLPEKIPTENAPDCVFCDCEKPDVKYLCSDISPNKPPDTPKLETKYIPLFYQYASTEPRNDAAFPKNEYDRTISTIVQAIEQGYTIDQIEGYTSPEGPLDHRRGKFEGNEKLSAARAERARDDIKAKIKQLVDSGAIGLDIYKDAETMKKRLVTANTANVKTTPKDEMYGSEAAVPDVPEKDLFKHLKTVVDTPDENGMNVLERDRVKGNALPEELRDVADKEITAFDTGIEGKKKLTEQQRLEKLYPWLRRALVILKPPPPVFVGDPLKLDPNTIKAVVGEYVACTDDHLKLFADTPMPSHEKLVVDNCSEKKTK